MTECSLRVVTGSEEGLRDRWTHGRVVLKTRSLNFLPSIGGTVFSRPGQKWLSITALDVSRGEERTSKGRETFSIHPSLRIVQVRTPNAELEWALRPEVQDWAIDRVNRDEG